MSKQTRVLSPALANDRLLKKNMTLQQSGSVILSDIQQHPKVAPQWLPKPGEILQYLREINRRFCLQEVVLLSVAFWNLGVLVSPGTVSFFPSSWHSAVFWIQCNMDNTLMYLVIILTTAE